MSNSYSSQKTLTNPPLRILHEDDFLLVVVKPPNLLSQEDETGDPDVFSLCGNHLVNEGQKNTHLGLVHRLDRPVGGIMILAKTKPSARSLSQQIRDQEMQKSYWGIVHGKTAPNGVLSHYLKKDESTNTVTATSQQTIKSRYAELAYQRAAHNEELTLLKVHLQTGRSHQIRVQLATEGYPIWGDQKYGKLLREEKGQQIALFAFTIRLKHPNTNEPITFVTSPPSEYPWNIFDQPFSR